MHGKHSTSCTLSPATRSALVEHRATKEPGEEVRLTKKHLPVLLQSILTQGAGNGNSQKLHHSVCLSSAQQTLVAGDISLYRCRVLGGEEGGSGGSSVVLFAFL